jgi:hypothetical protein
MRLRGRRRDLVVWSSSVGTADRYGAPRITSLVRTRRFRRVIRTCALLTIMGLMCFIRGRRGRFALAGAVLTVVGIVLRDSAGGVVLLPGLLFLLYAPLVPDSPEVDRRRRAELGRQLAAYSTPAQRRDLEAALDRYPDSVTRELRDLLASQATAAQRNGIPGTRC